MNTSQETVSGGHYPLSNLTYDLITVIHEKSKGIEAFDQYMKDAQGNQKVADLFNQIRQQDQQTIQQLQQVLQQELSSATAGAGSGTTS